MHCFPAPVFRKESAVGFLTVSTAVNTFFLVCQQENVGKLMLYGSDAAGILAVDDICDLFRQGQRLFFDDVIILDDVDRDVLIQIAKNV